MAELSLEGVHEKLRRAQEHFETLFAECCDFVARVPQPFSISIPYFDPATGYYVCKAIVREPPPVRLGVILGDVVHNARSALDHLVWQLVIANGQVPRDGPGGNQWPIVTAGDLWSKAASLRLKGVAAKQRELIRLAQPFNGGDQVRVTSSMMLGELSNTDKHQVVHATGALMLDPGEAARFSIKSGPGEIVQLEVRHFTVFEDGADILRARVEGRTDETEVWMEGGGPVEMAFGDRPITMNQVAAILEWVRVAVRDVEISLSSGGVS